MKKAIDTFVKNFNDINTVDYGDFMRMANNYLLALDAQIYDISDIHVQRMLDAIKNDIQYYPNWDIESTRKRTLAMINKIRESTENASSSAKRRSQHLSLVPNAHN